MLNKRSLNGEQAKYAGEVHGRINERGTANSIELTSVIIVKYTYKWTIEC